MVNELLIAELSCPQWEELAGTPAINGVPAVVVSTPCRPVSSGGITAFVPGSLQS